MTFEEAYERVSGQIPEGYTFNIHQHALRVGPWGESEVQTRCDINVKSEDNTFFEGGGKTLTDAVEQLENFISALLLGGSSSWEPRKWY